MQTNIYRETFLKFTYNLPVLIVVKSFTFFDLLNVSLCYLNMRKAFHHSSDSSVLDPFNKRYVSLLCYTAFKIKEKGLLL